MHYSLKIKLTALIFIIFNFYSIKGQNNNTEALLYNVVTGGLISGIGAIINKEKKEKLFPVFISGVSKGVLGGGMVYASKKLVFEFSKTTRYEYLWASKLINATGNSIIENGASNKTVLEKWHITFGFNRLEIATKGTIKLQYRIMPMALYGFIYSATQAKFNFSKSLKSAHPVFETDFIKTASISLFNSRGTVAANSITILNNLSAEEKTLAHEIIHSYQYSGFNRFNTFIIKPEKNWINHNNKTVKFFKKWFYADLMYVFKLEIYRIADYNSENYFDNFFEKEADFYSRKESFW